MAWQDNPGGRTVLTELPSGWELAVSASTGEVYYINSVTGESTYDWPAEEQREAYAELAQLQARGDHIVQAGANAQPDPGVYGVEDAARDEIAAGRTRRKELQKEQKAAVKTEKKRVAEIKKQQQAFVKAEKKKKKQKEEENIAKQAAKQAQQAAVGEPGEGVCRGSPKSKSRKFGAACCARPTIDQVRFVCVDPTTCTDHVSGPLSFEPW